MQAPLLFQLGVIAFSSSVTTPLGSARSEYCYQKILAKGTAENKQVLKEFLSYLEAGQPSQYTKALEAAIEYFKNTPEDVYYKEKRGKIMLVFY